VEDWPNYEASIKVLCFLDGAILFFLNIERHAIHWVIYSQSIHVHTICTQYLAPNTTLECRRWRSPYAAGWIRPTLAGLDSINSPRFKNVNIIIAKIAHKISLASSDHSSLVKKAPHSAAAATSGSAGAAAATAGTGGASGAGSGAATGACFSSIMASPLSTGTGTGGGNSTGAVT
jgi:hypothetical protein